MFPFLFRLLRFALWLPPRLRRIQGRQPGGASLQLEVPPGGGELLRLPRPVGVSSVVHRVRAAERGQVAGREVWRALGGSRGEAELRELFSDHQGRPDQRRGALRELHGGGRHLVQEDSSLHSERQALCDR